MDPWFTDETLKRHGKNFMLVKNMFSFGGDIFTKFLDYYTRRPKFDVKSFIEMVVEGCVIENDFDLFEAMVEHYSSHLEYTEAWLIVFHLGPKDGDPHTIDTYEMIVDHLLKNCPDVVSMHSGFYDTALGLCVEHNNEIGARMLLERGVSATDGPPERSPFFRAICTKDSEYSILKMMCIDFNIDLTDEGQEIIKTMVTRDTVVEYPHSTTWLIIDLPFMRTVDYSQTPNAIYVYKLE